MNTFALMSPLGQMVVLHAEHGFWKYLAQQWWQVAKTPWWKAILFMLWRFISGDAVCAEINGERADSLCQSLLRLPMSDLVYFRMHDRLLNSDAQKMAEEKMFMAFSPYPFYWPKTYYGAACRASFCEEQVEIVQKQIEDLKCRMAADEINKTLSVEKIDDSILTYNI